MVGAGRAALAFAFALTTIRSEPKFLFLALLLVRPLPDVFACSVFKPVIAVALSIGTKTEGLFTGLLLC